MFTQENLYERTGSSVGETNIIKIKSFVDRSKYDQLIKYTKKIINESGEIYGQFNS